MLTACSKEPSSWGVRNRSFARSRHGRLAERPPTLDFPMSKKMLQFLNVTQGLIGDRGTGPFDTFNLLDDPMKNDALRFFGFARLLALGTLSALLCSGAIAATASVIPLKRQNLILKDPGTAVLGAKDPKV